MVKGLITKPNLEPKQLPPSEEEFPAAAAAAAAATSKGTVDVSRLDLKVGKIIDIEKVRDGTCMCLYMYLVA